MKKIKQIITLIIIATLMSGCASIVSNSTWPVAIQSIPEAAKFTIRNQKGVKVHTGTTPVTIGLSSGAGYFDGEKYTLQFTKAGFQEKNTTLDTSLNGWYFGNLAFGGLIGMLIVDPSTGAMFRLPENFSTDLTAQSSSGAVKLKDEHQEFKDTINTAK